MSYNPRYRRKIRGKFKPYRRNTNPYKYLERVADHYISLVRSGRRIKGDKYSIFRREQEDLAIQEDIKRNPHKYGL